MTLQNAQAYVNYSIKEGYSSPEDWENLTDEELIKKATYEGNKGDYYANEASN